MKILILFSSRNSRISYIALIGILCFPSLVFGIEPIGTIGQPRPEQHAFLSDEIILRAVPTHIQIVDAHTGAVVDEFGERTRYSDVVFSPAATHLAILNHSFTEPRTINIWDVNAREQVMEWQFGSHVRFAAFSPTDSVFATSFKDGIHYNKKFAVVQDPWVQVRDLRTGSVKIQFPHRVGYSQEITFSPSGR